MSRISKSRRTRYRSSRRRRQRVRQIQTVAAFGVAALAVGAAYAGPAVYQHVRPERPRPVVGMLVDVSGSVHNAKLDPERREDVQSILDYAIAREARLVVDVISNGQEKAKIVVNRELRVDAADVDRDRETRELREELLEELDAEVFDAPAVAGSSIVAAIDTMSQHLANFDRTRPREVFLLTDGLNTGRPAALEGSADLSPAGIEAILGELRESARMATCPDWTVHMVGPGRYQSKHPLPPTRLAEVKRFWHAYFDSCGGTVSTYDTRLVALPDPAA